MEKDKEYIFKARCSKIAEIMTEPKGKSNAELYEEVEADIAARKTKHSAMSDKLKSKETLRLKILSLEQQLKDLEPIRYKRQLATTVQAYVDQFMKGYFWDRRKRIVSKAITKGNTTESESIQNIALVHELGYIDDSERNNQSMSNHYLMGTCDLLLKDRSIVIDAKSSWNLSTFPMYHKENPNKGYEMQLQGYMELYDVNEAWLSYCLNDSAPYMVQSEINRELWNQKKEHPELTELSYEDTLFIIQDMTFTYEGYINVCDFLDIKRGPDFTPIPLERRVRTFKYERDSSFMQKVEKRVGEINEYIYSNPLFAIDLKND